MKKQIRYIIIWDKKIDTFAIFYNSFEEANNKMLQLSSKEDRIFKVTIEIPKGTKNG